MTGSWIGDVLIFWYLVLALLTYVGISYRNNDHQNYGTYSLLAIAWPIFLVVGILLNNKRG